MLGLSGCASGPRFDGTEYHGEQVAFRLGQIPSDLRRVDSSDALLTFQDDDNGSTWAINARCGLDGDDVPLRALVQHLFLQFTSREQLSEKPLRLDEREALEVEVQASIDGVPRRFLVVVLKKDGCVYDFIHVDRGGDAPALVQSRDEFRAVVSGFRTL